ncbi:hypothetical protein FACS189487_04610 [Campylobacterota bacterium]|nr:hypothetical protein FACS189487_04610 [Campylobacterota bacterium]
METKNSSKSLIAKAELALSKMDFSAAALFFRQALDKNPRSKTAINGVLIADFCAKRPEIAPKLAEIYLSLMTIDRRRAKSFVLNVISEIEAEESADFAALERTMIEQDGIEYSDFVSLLKNEKSFTEIFENVTRSTNIFISRKQEWFDLVERLIDNGYTEIAYRFIENASVLWRSDDRAARLVTKLQAREGAKTEAI